MSLKKTLMFCGPILMPHIWEMQQGDEVSRLWFVRELMKCTSDL